MAVTQLMAGTWPASNPPAVDDAMFYGSDFPRTLGPGSPPHTCSFLFDPVAARIDGDARGSKAIVLPLHAIRSIEHRSR